VPKITYIEPDGSVRDTEVRVGMSVMEGATRNGIAGIQAICGGACSCATCHVHVDPSWVAQTGSAGDMEEAMLELQEDFRPNSRLACQIRVTPDLDGLVVRVVGQ
jgi:2Fe-2S ferredoxin